jgi:hypothetical protein
MHDGVGYSQLYRSWQHSCWREGCRLPSELSEAYDAGTKPDNFGISELLLFVAQLWRTAHVVSGLSKMCRTQGAIGGSRWGMSACAYRDPAHEVMLNDQQWRVLASAGLALQYCAAVLCNRLWS